MQYIYQAVGGFDWGTPGQHAEWTPIASFTNRADCEAFCKEENDWADCQVLTVEEIACVDNYGYPLTRKEWAELYPERIFHNPNMTFFDGRVFIEGLGLVYIV